jgi:hypothetical protein
MLHRVVERVVVMQIVVQQAVVLLVVMLQAVVRQVNQGIQLHKEYALLSGIVNNLASGCGINTEKSLVLALTHFLYN